jgi:hypothetical protein
MRFAITSLTALERSLGVEHNLGCEWERAIALIASRSSIFAEVSSPPKGYTRKAKVDSATVEKPVTMSSSTKAVWNIRLNGQIATRASGIGRSRYALKVATVFLSLPSWSY